MGQQNACLKTRDKILYLSKDLSSAKMSSNFFTLNFHSAQCFSCFNSRENVDASIYHLANNSWTPFPAGKPGHHVASTCGRATDAMGRDVIILAGSYNTADDWTSYILDVEVGNAWYA